MSYSRVMEIIMLFLIFILGMIFIYFIFLCSFYFLKFISGQVLNGTNHNLYMGIIKESDLVIKLFDLVITGICN